MGGFSYGNALNAVKDVHAQECFRLLGRAVGATSGSVSTIIRNNVQVESGVAAGTYTYATITVDAAGKVLSASSGTAPVFETGASILAKLITVDGAGSGLDADLLDGLSSAAFQPAGSYASSTVTLTAGVGLTGGGDLSANRTFAVDQSAAFTPTWLGVHTLSAQDIHNAGVSLGVSGLVTRAAQAAGSGVGIQFTSAHAASSNAADIAYLFKPTNTSGVNTSIFKIQNSAGSDILDIRTLGTAGGGAGNRRFRFGFDTSNYYNMEVTSIGGVTAGPVGTNPSFAFTSPGTLNFTATNAITFDSTTSDLILKAASGSAFKFQTSLSMVMADGMVISNAANTTGLTFGASVSDIFNFYGPATRTKAGASANFIGRPVVAIKQDTTQTGNTAVTETDLFSYSVPAATLNTNGESVSFEYAGTFANSINTKQVKVKFGATTIFDSGALAITGAGNWTIEGRVIRTGAATQKCHVRMTTTGATLGAYNGYSTAAETLSGAVTLKITGTATGASDIVGEANVTDWRAAA